MSLLGQTGSVEYDFRNSIEKGEVDGKFFVRVYVSLPYSSLQFTKVGTDYKASYHAVLEFIDKKKELYGTERFGEISVKSTEDVASLSRMVEETLEVTLPKGRYQGNISVRMLGATRTLSRDFDIELFHKALGSLVLTDAGGQRMLSKPFTGDDTLAASVPLYEVGLDSALLEISFKESSGFVHKETLTNPSKDAKWIIGLGKFSSGEYKVYVKAFSKGKTVDEEEAFFRIQKPFKLDPGRYNDLVDKLVYLATTDEQAYLRSVAPERRQAVWDSFWKTKDPTPQTEYNEVLENYFLKIDYCERNFGHGDKGYLSDRAKIYMRFGPPDQVEDYPFEMDRNPYIVWIYNGGSEFIFEDKLGFGQYVLVSPAGYLPYSG